MAIPLRQQDNKIGYGSAQVFQPTESPFFNEINNQRQFQQRDTKLEQDKQAAKDKLNYQKDKDKMSNIFKIDNLKENYAIELRDRIEGNVDKLFKAAEEDPSSISDSSIRELQNQAKMYNEVGAQLAEVQKAIDKGELIVDKDVEDILTGNADIMGDDVYYSFEKISKALANGVAKPVNWAALGSVIDKIMEDEAKGYFSQGNVEGIGTSVMGTPQKLGDGTVIQRNSFKYSPEYIAEKKAQILSNPQAKREIGVMAKRAGVDITNPEEMASFIEEYTNSKMKIRDVFGVDTQRGTIFKEDDNDSNGRRNETSFSELEIEDVVSETGEKKSNYQKITAPEKITGIKIPINTDGGNETSGFLDNTFIDPSTGELMAEIKYTTKTPSESGNPTSILKSKKIPYSTIEKRIKNSSKLTDKEKEIWGNAVSKLKKGNVEYDVTGLSEAVDNDSSWYGDSIDDLKTKLDEWGIKFSEETNGRWKDIVIDGVEYDISDSDDVEKMTIAIKKKTSKKETSTGGAY